MKYVIAMLLLASSLFAEKIDLQYSNLYYNTETGEIEFESNGHSYTVNFWHSRNCMCDEPKLPWFHDPS